jgi:hypothetical protein
LTPLETDATAAWALEAKAAFELAPLFEPAQGGREQVGFELELYARIPGGLAAPDAVVERIWRRLCEIAESLAPFAGEQGRVEVEAFDRADRLRRETGFAPEVLLRARLFHGGRYPDGVADDERAHRRQLEARLVALGLRPRSW